MENKQAVRNFMTRRIQGTSIQLLRAESFLIGQRFIGHFGDYESYLIYLDYRREVATGRLISNLLTMGRRVYVPVIVGDTLKCAPYYGADRQEMRLNKFGTWEPTADINHIDVDVIVLPCLACDDLGNRLGRGKGYYDRVLCRFDGTTVCFAYSFQVLESLSHITEPHDITADYVLTNKKTYGGINSEC